MTIQIGRAGRDSALTLRSPTHWSVDGDNVELDGVLDADTAYELAFLRAQVNGLVDNPDEPVVALNWPGDVTVDGFYRVVAGGVPMPPRGLAARRLNYRLRLRRVSMFPDISSVMVGNAVRTNAHSIAKGTTVPWWAVPDDATMDYIPSASSADRVTDSGTVKVWYRTDGTVLYNRTNRWACAASDYYDGACRFETTPDGSTWVAVVGRRLPGTPAASDGWRITNGLVRVSYGSGAGLLKVEHYLSAAGGWVVSKTYKLTVGSTPSTIGAFRTIALRRNSPEVVTITLGLDQATGTPAAVTVDLTIRRGALWVEGVMSRTSEVVTYLNNEMGIYCNSAEAATAHTAGLHATSADAQGGKYLLNTALAKTNDLTQGGFYANAAVNALDFQIGYEPPSAQTIDNFTNQTYAYMAPLDESVGVARR